MKISEDDKDFIINYYNNHGNLIELAKKYKCGQGIIRKKLQIWGIEKRKYFRESKVLKGCDQEIIDLYFKKWNLYKMAKYMDVHPETITRKIKELNLDTSQIPNGTKIYNVNHDFFGQIDTEEKAYLFGLWMADGGIYKNRINLSMADLDIMEKAKNCLQYTGPLRHTPSKFNNKIFHQLEIYSKKLFNDLNNKGCVPNKSLMLKFPYEYIPENLIRHFLRGMFDGDGSIYRNKAGYFHISLTGTREICEGFSKYSNLEGHYCHPNKKCEKKNTWSWRLWKIKEVYYFLDLLYSNSNIYLNRKKELANKILKGEHL
jgi:intein-encoded DNA endonuclease-like protein